MEEVGTFPTSCPAGQQYDAGLCYSKCTDGFTGVGPVCWGQCPADFADHGATCYHAPSVISRYPWGLQLCRSISKSARALAVVLAAVQALLNRPCVGQMHAHVVDHHHELGFQGLIAPPWDKNVGEKL